MTSSEQDLIRSSWAAVEPMADGFATLFYGRLFELDPRLSALFRYTDMEKQRLVLTQTLSVVVRNVDHLDQIIPEVEALGRRHVGYGVLPDDYVTVGNALLWTIQQCLGDGYTDATGFAWADAYRRVSSAMIEAAHVAERPSAPRTRRRRRTPASLALGLAVGSVAT